MKEIISIIIPVYQVEKYLRKCIESVLGQSYSDLEIILIDDGSMDACPEICEEYAKRDSRIKVIHQENRGLAAARNTGLDNRTGDYVAFVDSDDYIDRDYILTLYEMICRTNSSIAACGWEDIQERIGSIRKIDSADITQTRIFEGEESIRELLAQTKMDVSVWAKLYRAEIFHTLRFPEGILYEDFAIMFDVFEQAKRVCYNPYRGYCYLQRADGIMLRKFTMKKMDLIDLADNMVTRMCIKHPNLQNAIWERYVRANFCIYLQIPSGKEYREERTRIENNIRISRKKLHNAKLRRGTRAALLLTHLGFFTFRKFRCLKRWGK